MSQLPNPRPGAEVEWVRDHLGHLTESPVVPSSTFRGGQVAADAALAGLDITNYARKRNEVWPASRRGASMLSPYIRHGLLPLPVVWDAVADAPARDRRKFRDELLWQEYARHLYARLGARLGHPLRQRLDARPRSADQDPWDTDMACIRLVVDELEQDGWLVNQSRMWLSSHWTVRHGLDWEDGEERFFRHLLDGSRAANRAGWQWTVGTATGRPYGFSRWQVRKRAPKLCASCPHEQDCPIEDWPDDPPLRRIDPDPDLRRGGGEPGHAGVAELHQRAEPDVVWLTAESLGDQDPALAAHPELPVVFVFDEPLLAGLELAAKRLVFLVQCLAELAEHRDVELRLGRPVDELDGRALATTDAPVPGNRRLRRQLDVAAIHPWPWLRRPAGEPLTSFTAWRKATDRA